MMLSSVAIRFFANKSFTFKTSRMYSVTFPMHIDLASEDQIRLIHYIDECDYIVLGTWQCPIRGFALR